MKSIIKKLVIFGDDNEKRTIPFNEGLNILTGDSKTGKSAILEIIDYCLFSSRSTIPKGVIDTFSIMFSLVMKVEKKYLVISRTTGKSKASIHLFSVLPTDQELEYDNLKENLRPVKETQVEFEKHLGLSVNDPSEQDENSYLAKSGKVTIRSSLSLMLQHQNLVANKHSLFYRFDDFQKRKKAIEDFPVLIGWANSEYYDLTRRLSKLEQDLRFTRKAEKQLSLDRDEYLSELKSTIIPYYKLLDMELPSKGSLVQIKGLAKKLPEPTIASYSELDSQTNIAEYKRKIEFLSNELTEVNKLINQLTINTTLSGDYKSSLNFLSLISSRDSSEYDKTCPLCKQGNNNDITETNTLERAREKLQEEMSKVAGYTQDNTKQLGELRTSRNQLKHKMTQLRGQVEAIEKQDKNYQELKSKREAGLIMKGETAAKVAQLEARYNSKSFNEKIEEFKKEIIEVKYLLEKFDVKGEEAQANDIVNSKMNEICESLDFEEELRPGELHFDISNFDFYYKKDNQKIRLSEMGSGANWLACHLSLFLALLYLNCKNEKSCIPAILVIDQPSQVYFPNEYLKDGIMVDENITQVKNIYKVIAEQVSLMKEDTGFTPQIIALEHAKEDEFSKYIIQEWKKDGKKLI